MAILKNITIYFCSTIVSLLITLNSCAQESDTSSITGNEIRQQLFPPTPLPADYHFEFGYPFKEMILRTADGMNMHSLVFPAARSKGVILYLHGSLDEWEL